MRIFILLLFFFPIYIFSQTVTEISEVEFLNANSLAKIQIKEQENSFINLYTYEYEKTTPMLYIGDADYSQDFTIIKKSDEISEFNYVKIGNFFDFDFWIVANHYIDGNPQLYLINKSENTVVSMVDMPIDKLLNSIKFYDNGYFVINYNSGCCDEMEGCNFGFSLYKYNQNNIQRVFWTSEWFAHEIKWQNSNTILINAKKGDCNWDEYEEMVKDYKFLKLK